MILIPCFSDMVPFKGQLSQWHTKTATQMYTHRYLHFSSGLSNLSAPKRPMFILSTGLEHLPGHMAPPSHSVAWRCTTDHLCLVPYTNKLKLQGWLLATSAMLSLCLTYQTGFLWMSWIHIWPMQSAPLTSPVTDFQVFICMHPTCGSSLVGAWQHSRVEDGDGRYSVQLGQPLAWPLFAVGSVLLHQPMLPSSSITWSCKMPSCPSEDVVPPPCSTEDVPAPPAPPGQCPSQGTWQLVDSLPRGPGPPVF